MASSERRERPPERFLYRLGRRKPELQGTLDQLDSVGCLRHSVNQFTGLVLPVTVNGNTHREPVSRSMIAYPPATECPELGDRLRWAIEEHAGLKQSDVAADMGKKRGAVNRWIAQNAIDEAALLTLARLTGVSPAWLRYGEVPQGAGLEKAGRAALKIAATRLVALAEQLREEAATPPAGDGHGRRGVGSRAAGKQHRGGKRKPGERDGQKPTGTGGASG